MYSFQLPLAEIPEGAYSGRSTQYQSHQGALHPARPVTYFPASHHDESPVDHERTKAAATSLIKGSTCWAVSCSPLG